MLGAVKGTDTQEVSSRWPTKKPERGLFLNLLRQNRRGLRRQLISEVGD